MHRDKTVARILLILSVVHVVVAAPSIVRQRSLDVDEDVTPTLEKRGNPVDDSPQDLSSVPQMDNEPPTSGIPPTQDHSPLKSGTPQLYNDQPQASGPPPSQDATSPASGDSQSHSGPPAGSNDPQLHNTDWRSTGEMVQGESSAQLESGVPGASVHDDMSIGSGNSNHAWDPWTTDFPVGEGTPSWTPMDQKSSVWSETPPESEAPPPPPEAKEVFSDAMKKRLKVVAGFGVLAGFTGGLIYSVHKLIKDHSHGAYVSAFFPPTPADI